MEKGGSRFGYNVIYKDSLDSLVGGLLRAYGLLGPGTNLGAIPREPCFGALGPPTGTLGPPTGVGLRGLGAFGTSPPTGALS